MRNFLLLILFAVLLFPSITHAAYDPTEGRWLSRDPIGINGGINLYRYAANNPVYWIDPLGLTIYPANFVGPLQPGDSYITPRGPVYPNGQPSGLPGSDWFWSPDKNNSRGGTWRMPGQKSSASWDCSPSGRGGAPGKPHWDLDNGSGTRTRLDENGKPVTVPEAHPQGNPSPSTPEEPSPKTPETAPEPMGPRGPTEPMPELPELPELPFL
jgi:uncharacterized protein RhaS with RHS repeats